MFSQNTFRTRVRLGSFLVTCTDARREKYVYYFAMTITLSLAPSRWYTCGRWTGGLRGSKTTVSPPTVRILPPISAKPFSCRLGTRQIVRTNISENNLAGLSIAVGID